MVSLQDANRIFWEFATKYDTTNNNLLRKIIHSYSVAEKCFSIASSLKLDKSQRDFCYIIGLFHDIGRFEQWKKYGTFFDKISENHGFLGAKILEGFLDKLGLTIREQEIMHDVIKYHNAYYEGTDEDVRFYHRIVKNGDMFANVIAAANGVHQIMIEKDGATPGMLEDFCNLKPLYKYPQETKLDRALMLSALVYYLDFDFLRKEALEKGYLDSIYSVFATYLNKEDASAYKTAIAKVKKKLEKSVEK